MLPAQQPVIELPKDARSVTVPLLSGASGFHVEASLNGHRVLLRVETGLSHSVVDFAVADALGLFPIGVKSRDYVRRRRVDDLRVGPARVLVDSIRAARSAVAPEEAVGRDRRRVVGFLGMDVLGARPFTMDVPAKTLTWHEHGAFAGTAYEKDAFVLQLDRGLPVLRARLGADTPASLILGTGTYPFGVTLRPEFVARHPRLVPEQPLARAFVRGVGGRRAVSTLFRLRVRALGRDLRALASAVDTPVTQRLPDSVDGALGLGALDGARLRVDARTKRIHVEWLRKKSVEERLAAGVDPDQRDLDGWTLLHHAVGRFGLADVKALLAAGVDVHAADRVGRTALVMAAFHLEMVEMLLAKGASPKAGGGRPLVAAAGLGRNEVFAAMWKVARPKPEEVTRPLLAVAAKGASLSILRRVLDAGHSLQRDEERWSLQHHAALGGNPAIIRFLKDRGHALDERAADGATPLLAALRFGRLRAARVLLELGADPKAVTTKGETAWHVAMAVPSYAPTIVLDAIALIRETKAPVNATDRSGHSALTRALRSRQRLEVIQALLAAGADARAVLPDGTTTVMLAASVDDVRVLQALVDAGAEVAARDARRNLAVHMAAGSDNRRVLEFLAAKGVPLDARNDVGTTPLGFASLGSHVATVDWLLARGAETKPEPPAVTPLMVAARGGSVEIVERLLPRSDIEARNHSRATALAHAVTSGRSAAVAALLDAGAKVDVADSARFTPLHVATFGHDAVSVQKLLAKGAKLEARTRSRETALRIAIRVRDVRIVKMLLSAGAGTAKFDNREGNALHFAAELGFVDVVQVLLAHGLRVDAKDLIGGTALHHAARRNHVEVCKVLLAAGADVNARTGSDWTPLHFAAQWNRPETVTLLLAKGADKGAKTKSGKTPLEITRPGSERVRALLK